MKVIGCYRLLINLRIKKLFQTLLGGSGDKFFFGGKKCVLINFYKVSICHANAYKKKYIFNCLQFYNALINFILLFN